MKLNPFLNALLAGLYIAGVAFLMSHAESFSLPEKTLLVPMVFLSLFVLSAAVMGFLFLYEPFRLYVEGKGHEGLRFFGKTLGSFAALVALLLVVLVMMFR